MDSTVLRNIFRKAFIDFIKTDRLNIINDVAERNLCARLSIFLQKSASLSDLEGYFADAEYNRNFNGRVKTIITKGENDEEHIVKIVCDLILHSRGTIPEMDNLIALEMKKANGLKEINVYPFECRT